MFSPIGNIVKLTYSDRNLEKAKNDSSLTALKWVLLFQILFYGGIVLAIKVNFLFLVLPILAIVIAIKVYNDEIDKIERRYFK